MARQLRKRRNLGIMTMNGEHKLVLNFHYLGHHKPDDLQLWS